MDMEEYNLMHNEDLNIHHNLEIVLYMNNIDIIDEADIVLKILISFENSNEIY